MAGQQIVGEVSDLPLYNKEVIKIKVVALKLKDDQGRINFLDRANFDKNYGMLAEGILREENRQISILSRSVRDQIDREAKNGLCLLKFYENITVEGLDASTMHVGQRLKIGETIQEITSIGKRCFDECKLFQTGQVCKLHYNVIFSKILENGSIEIGDKVTPLG